MTYSYDLGKATYTLPISLTAGGVRYDNGATYDDGVSKYAFEGDFLHNEILTDRGNLFNIQFSGASEVESKIYNFSLMGPPEAGTKEFKQI